MFELFNLELRSTTIAGFAMLGGAALLVPLAASADGPPAPPPEAYAACDSKTAGDACTVTLHDHTLEGTCAQRGSDGRLSCRPSHPPPMPREAVEACTDKKQGGSCSVTFGGHTLDGVCEEGPEGALHCRPSGPPPG
jgi:hypothetical protein